MPARRVRAGQTVELRLTPALVAIHALTSAAASGEGEGRTLLACHARAPRRGSWQVDQAHWDGLPDGHTRATTLDPAPERTRTATGESSPLLALLADHHAADTVVARRSLAAYQQLGEQLAGATGDGHERGQVSA